ncbi:MAG: hypothetical protein ATN35_05400 [Epulopiscium sp. Nele67-Bin004]|nr:MAG: hypothetical protein ATN35_05400 [Epulopiscium sp. Nele67-Bin004]
MQILKYELKIRLKPFILWCIALILLFVSGSMEFEGIAGANSESINVILNYYPPIVLALMGITESIDFVHLEGYVWVLGYMSTVIASFYALTLGSSVVNRELIDKTFEFLFTKPKKRTYILSIKVLSGILYLTGFSLLNFTCSLFMMNPLDANIDISNLMFLSSVGTYVTSLVFFVIAICISILVKKHEQSSKIINLFFLISFILGGIYDVVDNANILRIFTPLRYFLYKDAQGGNISISFILFSGMIIIVLMTIAYSFFKKRDLTEI